MSFYDGFKLTAGDVVYSMNRHLGEASTSVIKSVLASVTEWKNTGGYESQAVMDTPNADLPTVLGIF